MQLKNTGRIVYLSILGFSVALVLYPLAHEAGHIISSMIFGGRICEVTWLPLPSVLCDMTGVSGAGIAVTGISGILLPFVISAAVHPKRFPVWYTALVFKGITLLSFVISAAELILNSFGITDADDDMIKVLDYWNGGSIFLIFMCAAAGLVTAFSIVRDRPAEKIYGYFEI